MKIVYELILIPHKIFIKGQCFTHNRIWIGEHFSSLYEIFVAIEIGSPFNR